MTSCGLIRGNFFVMVSGGRFLILFDQNRIYRSDKTFPTQELAWNAAFSIILQIEIEQLPNPAILLNRAGRIIHTNQSAIRLVGPGWRGRFLWHLATNFEECDAVLKRLKEVPRANFQGFELWRV